MWCLDMVFGVEDSRCSSGMYKKDKMNWMKSKTKREASLYLCSVLLDP